MSFEEQLKNFETKIDALNHEISAMNDKLYHCNLRADCFSKAINRAKQPLEFLKKLPEASAEGIAVSSDRQFTSELLITVGNLSLIDKSQKDINIILGNMIDFTRETFKNFSSPSVQLNEAKKSFNDLGEKALSPEQVTTLESAKTQMENAEEAYKKQNLKINEFKSSMHAIASHAETPPISSHPGFFMNCKQGTPLPEPLRNMKLGDSVSYEYNGMSCTTTLS
ncbi:MAG: hypothetical protein NTU49_06110 [Gammaproteobacteria bacterium]|nr:hypothetical protein [Gammaproteobacteria bacterium]